MSLLRIVVVPLLKVILPGQISLRFSAAFKASCFSKFLVALFGEHERTDMAFAVSIISRSVISPGLLVMCENMSNCRRSTYHRQSLGSWLVL